jgi:hypothetical protein
MDNPTKTARPDPDRININEDDELRNWSDKLDVTKVRLKAAVNAVGTSVKDVQAYLKKR